MGDKKSNDVTGVEANDALSASGTESVSDKTEHHSRKSTAVLRDLESAIEEANTAEN